MPVNFHCQYSTVPVSKPSADRLDVHAGFNATRGEQMAQVMVGNPVDPGKLASSCE